MAGELRYWVRCLGPGTEHWFYSRDRCSNRICYKCVAALAKQQYRNTNMVRDPKNHNNKDHGE